MQNAKSVSILEVKAVVELSKAETNIFPHINHNKSHARPIPNPSKTWKAPGTGTRKFSGKRMGWGIKNELKGSQLRPPAVQFKP
jgi:hypothetical protein